MQLNKSNLGIDILTSFQLKNLEFLVRLAALGLC